MYIYILLKKDYFFYGILSRIDKESTEIKQSTLIRDKRKGEGWETQSSRRTPNLA